MLYRSNTLRVLCPDSFIATRSEMPARTMFRTAVLRRSWGIPNPEWLPDGNAERLLDASPDANVAVDLATSHLGRALEELPALQDNLTRFARERGESILDAHRRVRKATHLAVGRLMVEPRLPVDVLGVFVYLPVTA